jgi:hypothetical protein
VRLELTTTGATTRRSIQLSYGHTDDGWNRTSVSGTCNPAPCRSATSSFLSARRAGIAPAASRFEIERSADGTDGVQRAGHRPTAVRRRGLEPDGGAPPKPHLRQRVYSPPQLPLCHLRFPQWRVTHPVSVEGLEPSTPCARGTCAAKLRYTLMQHLRQDSNLHSHRLTAGRGTVTPRRYSQLSRAGSNREPPGSEPGALPVELRLHRPAAIPRLAAGG